MNTDQKSKKWGQKDGECPSIQAMPKTPKWFWILLLVIAFIGILAGIFYRTFRHGIPPYLKIGQYQKMGSWAPKADIATFNQE